MTFFEWLQERASFIGCIICNASNNRRRRGKWGRCLAAFTVPVKDAFKPMGRAQIQRHASTPLHRNAVEAKEDRAPGEDEFRRVWENTQAGHNTNGVLGQESFPIEFSKKDRAMQWCLAEAHREASRRHLAVAVMITLMHDKRHG